MSFNANHSILAGVSKDFVIQGLARGDLRSLSEHALAQTGRGHKRSCPLRPLLVIWLVVAMALHRNLAIPNVFRRLLHMLKPIEPGLGRNPVTEEALYHARERLGARPLKLLFGAAVKHCLTPVSATFHGLREFAIDGSEFTVPDTPANEAVFGRHRSQRGDGAYPQMRGVFLTAIAKRQIQDACLMPCSTGEQAALTYLLRELGPGDLVLIDRGLGSFAFFLRCHKKGVRYVARIAAHWKPKLLERLGQGDSLVELRPCSVAWQKLGKEDRSTRIIARLIEFRVGEGEKVRLLTDLVSPTEFPALELAREYHRRWEAELTYKEVKIELLAVTEGKQKTHFRSKTPIGVHQEAWAALLAHNLVRELMAEAADAADVSPLELSFVESLEVIKLALPGLQTATRVSRMPLRASLIRDLGQCLIDRPRRARAFPRKVKRKMSNFHLKGPEDRARKLDLRVTFLE